ncbi:hypothetical protein Sru01_05200 [Sphaerisporangium rufum]|uniref:Uncharacterized protein n=1 Tax=Sphaerisporangium rufum TaxID=1381558 RepID=A0A919UZF9_9ACTN|nr:DUF6188 family protein [Sphaerisporangium rufum]GII75538.1 hypothetical protein Sru01_05200 [Sphaerisporangium rufum]
MDLRLGGQSVVRVAFDAGVTLLTDSGYEVRIEAAATLSSEDGTWEVTPGAPTPAMTRMIELFGAEILSARASVAGTLSIHLAGGRSLIVEPDDHFEAWTMAGPGGALVVCMPAGELALWRTSDG